MLSSKGDNALNILEKFLGFLDEVIIQKVADTDRSYLDTIRLINNLIIDILPLFKSLYQPFFLHMLKDIKPIALIDIKELLRLKLLWIYILSCFQALIEISQYLVNDNVIIILSHSSSISVFTGGTT